MENNTEKDKQQTKEMPKAEPYYASAEQDTAQDMAALEWFKQRGLKTVWKVGDYWFRTRDLAEKSSQEQGKKIKTYEVG